MKKETFETVRTTVNTEYKLTTADVVVTCNATRLQNGGMTGLNGSVYRNDGQGGQGEYIGSFNGRMDGGEMKYSFPEMNRSQSETCWETIALVEEQILPQADADADNGKEE